MMFQQNFNTQKDQTSTPKFLKSLAVVASFIYLLTNPTSSAIAGHGLNNGGDHIRATFIRMGHAVLSYLRETDEGSSIVTSHDLSLLALEQTLNIGVLEVVDGLLLDNGGSAVDATGEPGKIRLSSERWINHFESERDVYFLVFHEMLRAVAMNDDNYIISKAINPFPQGRRILTRTTTKYPLLGAASLADIFDPAAIQLTGEGCPRGIAGTFLDFDAERNILDITFNKYDVHVGSLDPTSGRKACSVVIPFKSRKGTKLKIMQMDFSAKVELPAEAQAAISASVAFGNPRSSHKTSSIKAAQKTQGRLLVRQGNVYETSCNGSPGLISIQSAASAITPSKQGAMVSPDRISLSFVIESCEPNQQ